MPELLIDDLIPVALVIGAASGHVKCLSPAAKYLWVSHKAYEFNTSGDISCAPALGQELQSGITWDAQQLPEYPRVSSERQPVPADISLSQTVQDRRSELPESPPVLAVPGSSFGPESPGRSAGLPQEPPRPEQQQEEEQQQEDEDKAEEQQQQQREAEEEEEQIEYPQQQPRLSIANTHRLDPDQLGPHQQHSIGHQQELHQTDLQVDAQGGDLQQQQQGLPRQDALVPPTESSLLDGPPGRRLAAPRQPVAWFRAADVPPLSRRLPPPGVNADPSQPYYISDILQLRNVPHAITELLPDDAPDNAATAAAEGGIALPHDRTVSSRAMESEMAPSPGPRPGMAPLLENSPVETVPRPSGWDPDGGPGGFGGEHGRRHNLEDSARGLGIYTRIPPPRAAAAAAVPMLALASGRYWAHSPRWATAAERNAGVRRLAAPVLRTAAVAVGEQAGPSTTPASAIAPAAAYAARDGAAWQGGVRRSMSMQVNPEGRGGSGHSGSWLEGSRLDRDLPGVFPESRASRRTIGLSPRLAHMGQVAPIPEAGEEAVTEERVAGVREEEVEVAGGQNEDPGAAVAEVDVEVEAEVESAAQRERLTLQRPAEAAAGAVSVWDARAGVGPAVPAEHVDAECSPFTGAQAAAAAASSVSDSSEYSPFKLSQIEHPSQPDHQLQSPQRPQRTHKLYHTQRPTRLAAAEAGPAPAAAAVAASTNMGGRGPRRLRRRSTRGRLHTLLAEHLGTAPGTAPARLWPSVQQHHGGSGGGAGAGGSESGAVGQGFDRDGDRQGARGEDEADEQQQQQEEGEEEATSQEESQSDTRSCWYMARLQLIMPRPRKSGAIRRSAAVPLGAASGGPSTSTSQPPLSAAAAAAPLAASASGNELFDEPLLRLVLYDVDEHVRDVEALEGDLGEVTAAMAAAVQRETQLETLLTCQHKLLEAVFPRQAIEHMTRNIASQSPAPTEPRSPPHPAPASAFSSRRSLIATRAAAVLFSSGAHPPTALTSNSRVCIGTTTNRAAIANTSPALLSTTETSLETALLPHGLMTTLATTAAALSIAAAAAAADNDGLWEGQGRGVPRRLRAVPVAPGLPGQIASAPTAAAAAASIGVRGRAEGLSAAARAGRTGPGFLSLPALPPSLPRLQQQQGRLSAAGLGVGGGAAGALGTIPLAFTAPMVTVLFADIVGFTSMCTSLKPMQVMAFLNSVFTRLDSLCDVFGVYKVETIGDCYMVAGGLIAVDGEGFKAVRGDDSVDTLHALKAMSFAKAMLREVAATRMPRDNTPLRLRVGLHSGPVTAGIVGAKMPRFCLFGDTVNTASRMESTCEPGRIHVSAATRELLPEESWRPTGGVHVKGKGEMETYLWCPPPDFVCPKSAFSASVAVGSVGGHHYPGGGEGGGGAGAIQRPGWSGPVAPPGAGGAAGGRSAISDGELVRQQMVLARAAATAAVAAGAGRAAAVAGAGRAAAETAAEAAVAAPLGQEAASEPSAPQ